MGVASTRAQRMAAIGLDEARDRFIDDIGQLYARYGLTPTFGRVFGLLLLSDEPLGLDEISRRLGVSKSGTSVAARELERAGISRRMVAPGSRRVLYEANDNLDHIFEASFARIRHSLHVLEGADGLATGRGRQRIAGMKALHEFWLEESERILENWRRRQS